MTLSDQTSRSSATPQNFIIRMSRDHKNVHLVVPGVMARVIFTSATILPS
jgi:hypothetical protein